MLEIPQRICDNYTGRPRTPSELAQSKEKINSHVLTIPRGRATGLAWCARLIELALIKVAGGEGVMRMALYGQQSMEGGTHQPDWYL
jgi:hypothetical protein